MRGSIQLIAALGLVLIFGAMNGCGTTKPSRFYALNPVTKALSGEPADGPSVGIGPVRVARYLDRSQIVRQKNTNELEIDEFNRWLEPLDDSVARVLALNLSTMVPTSEIHRVPWRQSTTIEFQVIVNVMQFHADANNRVLFTASWSLLDGKGTELVPSNLTVLSGQADDAEYTSLAAAMSEILAQFSREIAQAIQARG